MTRLSSYISRHATNILASVREQKAGSGQATVTGPISAAATASPAGAATATAAKRAAEGSARNRLLNRLNLSGRKTGMPQGVAASQAESDDGIRKITGEGRGGTFASKGSDKVYTLGEKPALGEQEQDLRTAVGPLKGVDFTLTEPAYYIDSSNLSPDDILAAVKTDWRQHADNGDRMGCFTLHGTDTLLYAACAAKMAGIPGIFTGAMKPANSENKDGPQNARNAMLLAASNLPELQGQTLVVMNNKIYDPMTVYKGDTSDVDAFKPGAAGLIGTIVDGKITIENKPVAFPFSFDLSEVSKLPPVTSHVCKPYDSLSRQKEEIVSKLKLETASEYRYRVDSNVEHPKVLIVEGFGNGMIPENLKPFLKMLEEVVESEVLVIRTTQAPEGEVSDRPEDMDNRFINGGHLRGPALALFTQFFLATQGLKQNRVGFDELRAAVRAIQPVAQHDMLE